MRIKPKFNPAGPMFNRVTGHIAGNGIKSGKIDGKEQKILGKVQNDIKHRVALDKKRGLDPRKDPLLAKMQITQRKMTHAFLNFNPS